MVTSAIWWITFAQTWSKRNLSFFIELLCWSFTDAAAQGFLQTLLEQIPSNISLKAVPKVCDFWNSWNTVRLWNFFFFGNPSLLGVMSFNTVAESIKFVFIIIFFDLFFILNCRWLWKKLLKRGLVIWIKRNTLFPQIWQVSDYFKDGTMAL